MPLPYHFLSGDLARSSQVNANFQYLMDLIGQASRPGEIQPLGSIVVGPRKTATLSAEQDSGGREGAFVQLSWNASWTKVGSAYKFKRTLNTTGAAAIRVGLRGLELLATDKRTGDINTQLRTMWRVSDDEEGRFMYLPEDVRVGLKDTYPARQQERRLMTVLLDEPVAIYKMKPVSKGTSAVSAYSYGIPRNAAAIIINAHVTAGPRSGAGMLFFKQTGPDVDHSHNYNGFVAHATITGTGMGMRTGNQGVVPLGTGSYAGRFFIHRTEYFELANVWIIGYLV